MKLDNIYKFVAATFAIAYFIGLVTGLVVNWSQDTVIKEEDISKSFYLTGQFSFKQLFTENLATSAKIAPLPFSYIIIATNYGFSHASYLISPFLGQIKLAVLLIPQIFYFIGFILFSAIGLKLIATIIFFVINKWLLKGKPRKTKIVFFRKDDVLFFYLALLSIALGTTIQTYLSKVFFIFLINFQFITYVLIILMYLTLVAVSLFVIYTTIRYLIKTLSGSEKL